MLKTVTIFDQPVQIDTSGDYYGEVFWDKITRNQWEPDTFSFVQTYCNNDTHFMDIGAANGAITLAAAVCGSTVTSYEPDPIIVQNLKRNALLNSSLAEKIEINHCAISDKSGKLTFSADSNPEILTNILFRERSFKPTSIEVKSIITEINRLAAIGKKIVIKIDIEGAEFKILSNQEVLNTLKSAKVLVLLAIHPGFNRKYKKSKINHKISEKLWRYENIRENQELFRKLILKAQIRRTNLNLINDMKQFSSLADSGYHEFILDFGGGYFL